MKQILHFFHINIDVVQHLCKRDSYVHKCLMQRVEQELQALPEHLRSSPGCGCMRGFWRSSFSFLLWTVKSLAIGHCIVCSSNYNCWIFLWYLPIFLSRRFWVSEGLFFEGQRSNLRAIPWRKQIAFHDVRFVLDQHSASSLKQVCEYICRSTRIHYHDS